MSEHSPGHAATRDIGMATALNLSSGKLTATDDPYDLAIASDGFFELRGPDGPVHTRHGRFRRDAEGRLLGAGDLAVQVAGGGDLILGPGRFEVASDGTVLEDGQPRARLAIMDFVDGASPSLSADGQIRGRSDQMAIVDSPTVRQGMLEASNVAMGVEMIALMESIRQAETGQRLMTLYDDLMGRAVTTFGQA